MPKVSVILCVYNGEEFLRDAIESVLSQTYQNIEFIAIDDGSDDGTLAILGEYPTIKTVSLPENKGIANARNRGIAEAEGRYITFIDADDIWVDEKVRRQVEYHLANPEFDYSFVMERFFFSDDKLKPNWSQKEAFTVDHTAYGTSGIFVRKEVYNQVGGFQAEFSGMENGEWLFRAKDMGFQGGVIEEVFLHRRIHRNNVSGNVEKNVNLLFRNIKSSIDRQKGEQ